MLRKTVIAVLILFHALSAAGQNKPVQFDQLPDLQAGEARPVAILVTTSWCKYCHAMKNAMLAHKKVAALLGDKFRTIFLDAEEKQEIFFAGRTFRFRQGVNELARELASVNGRVSYPTLCILNSKNEVIYQYDGYLPAAALLYTLNQVSKLKN